ncbi:efflux RND transporter periplasmic adaptor subunit [Salinispora arenicola]|uniref:efflux RND transporter periplasmic adaptor subunit n=1 Tax=Salinispora arenicola TaxID=168697 RepID=UPI000375C2E5|nr:peptidoglycan-binding protein [Salinispora arenicola]
MKIKSLVGVVVVAAVAGLIALLNWPTSHTSDASVTEPKTGTVTKGTLADTKTVSGTLGYGSSTTLSSRVGGTLTALAEVGATVKRGQVLYRVDDQPVVLLQGTLPAYRALRPGVKGADVKQLEQNLKALGYTGFTVDETYSAATATVVKKWQKKLGLPKTGVVEPGRVVYAPGAVRIEARQAAVGDAAQPGQGVLKVSGTDRVVTVKLDVADQRLAKQGVKVKLTLPDGTVKQGTVKKVQTVVETGETGGNGDSTTKIEVTIALPPVTGLDSASVDTAFTASVRENVLTVPVAALLALAEGGYGVEVITPTGSHLIAVETGLFSNGRVEISGPEVTEGLTVGLPS